MSTRTHRRPGRRILFGSTVLVLLSATAIAGLRLILANNIAIEGPGTVHESGYVNIGGQPQWIELRGWNRANPVLLWLHGGPGIPILSAGYSSFLPWERQFTIVHWHQPGAGLTYAASDGSRPLTIDTMVNDGIEVAEYARSRLHKEKIILVGHSWGSVLGGRMIQRRPDLFAAYVATGQVTTLEDDGRDLFIAAMAKAKRDSNSSAIHALEGVANLPLTDVHRMDVVREWGKTEDISDNPLFVYLGPLLSPGYSVRDVLSLARGFEKSRAALFDQAIRVNMPRDVPEIEVAAFLFQGRADWQVSTPSALRYFEQLKAPTKEVVLLEGGHFVSILRSGAFLQALVEKVRPLASETPP